jgi:hypothetical protein
MAIYNLDNIIDTIVEASNPAEPMGLQMLDAFKALNHNVKKQKLSRFIQQLNSITDFLKRRAKEGMNQFFTTYSKYRGNVPAEIYTTPGLIRVAIHTLCDNTEGITAFIKHYGQYFNLQAVDVGMNSLSGLLRKATDPEGKRDKRAYEQASSDMAAYNAVNEALENDPVNEMLLAIKNAYQKLRLDLINLNESAKYALRDLDENLIEQGKEIAGDAIKLGQDVVGGAAELGGQIANKIGDAVKPYDPSLGASYADKVKARQRQDAAGFFQDAPATKPKFKPLPTGRHQELLRQYKEADEVRKATAGSGGYSESIVDQVANMLTEDPDIIIS